jgi:hypothetical protein
MPTRGQNTALSHSLAGGVFPLSLLEQAEMKTATDKNAIQPSKHFRHDGFTSCVLCEQLALADHPRPRLSFIKERFSLADFEGNVKTDICPW